MSHLNRGLQRTADKGRADGYASLGSDGKVPTAQLPDMGGGGPHTHPQSDVTGLDAALGDKSDVGHTHSALPPSGGTTGQVLAKASNTNYDFTWSTPSGGSASLDDPLALQALL